MRYVVKVPVISVQCATVQTAPASMDCGTVQSAALSSQLEFIAELHSRFLSKSAEEEAEPGLAGYYTNTVLPGVGGSLGAAQVKLLCTGSALYHNLRY